MRKIISIVMIMFVTLGIIPANAASKSSTDLKAKIEQNIKSGTIHKDIIMKIGNYHNIKGSDFFQMAKKLEDLVTNLVGNTNNVLLKVDNDLLYVITSDTTLTGDLSGKTYRPTFDGSTLSSLEFVGDIVDTADIDTRMTYGILSVKSLDGETLSYKGSFYPPNTGGNVRSYIISEPTMSLTLSEDEVMLNYAGDYANFPVECTTNLSKINVDTTLVSITNERGDLLDLHPEFSTKARIKSGYNPSYTQGTYKDGVSRIVLSSVGYWTDIMISQTEKNKNLFPVGKTYFNYDVVMSPGDI